MQITVPTSWDDITVTQYQALTQINKDSYNSDLSYTVAVLQVLCNLDSTNELPLSAVAELSSYISFLTVEPSKEKYKELEFRGKTYEWIDSFNAITVGEAISIELPIDLEELTYSMAYDVVLAVMLREKGKKFDAKEFKKNRALFGELPITEVIGQLLFFLSGGQTSTAHLKTYSIAPKTTTISRRRKLPKWKRVLRKLKIING